MGSATRPGKDVSSAAGNRPGVTRGVRPVLVGVCLLLLVAGLVAGAGSSPGGGPTGSAAPAQAAPVTPDGANATPVRHEDPSDLDGSGDLESLERWLAADLASRLSRSTIEIGRGDYDRARALLGDGYGERLGQYVDVADETPAEADDEAASTFGAARSAQRSFADRLATYRRLDGDYREARARGEVDRARRLATDLEATADRINRTGTGLEAAYASLGRRAGVDVDESIDRIESERVAVLERQATVVDQTFVRTRLSATISRQRISFRRPGRLAVRLVTADGSSVRLDRFRLRIGRQNATVLTDAEGRFVVEYRPVGIDAGPTDLDVQYRPAPTSAYFGATTHVPVRVEAVTPEVSVSSFEERARFDEPVGVTGAVRVGATGVPDVPVVVTIDGEPLGRTTTGSTGLFDLEGRLPAAVGTGDRNLTAHVAWSGRAIAAASGRVGLGVAETPTALSASVGEATDSAVTVEGRLRTANGTAVPDGRVHVGADNSALRTVRTDDDGRFRAAIDRARLRGASRLTATFTGRGTNLGSSEAGVSLAGLAPIEPAREGPSPLRGIADFDRVDPTTLALVGAVGLLLSLWVVGRWRARRRGPGTDEAEASGAGADRVDRASGGPEEAVATAEALLAAREADRAVEAAYAAVRERLGPRLDRPEPLTHWEFLSAASADGFDAAELDRLRALTEGFERAAFTAEGVSAAAARDAVATAKALVGIGPTD